MLQKIRGILFIGLRWFWLLYTGFIWILWLVSIPGFISQAMTGTMATIESNGNSIAQMAVESAAMWGLSVSTWVWFNTAVVALSALIFLGASFLIWWRVRTGFGLLTAYVLVLGTVYMDKAVSSANYPAAVMAVYQLGAGLWPLFVPWLFLFPNGRAVPRRFLWVLGPMFALFAGMQWLYILTLYLPETSLLTQVIAPMQPVQDMLVLIMVTLTLVAQVYRYARVSNQLEKQQVRWFLFGLMLLVLPTLPLALLHIRYPIELDIITFAALPLGIGISILRYRLWDIDLIIRKTVQYGVVTAVLAFIYFGTIILLQSLVGQATGEQSPIIIILSTLLIAALFSPLRQRVQDAVDRRFYRQKYDAAQVLADFAQTARDEVDMEALQAELLRVVQETLQPESVVVWFKQSEGETL